MRKNEPTIHFSYEDQEIEVAQFEWAYKHGGVQPPFNGIPISLHLLTNYYQHSLFVEAISSGDTLDATIKFSGGKAIRPIPLKQATVVEYREVGEFDPNPAVSSNVYSLVKLHVDSIDYDLEDT